MDQQSEAEQIRCAGEGVLRIFGEAWIHFSTVGLA
jgi:hypothetical protein